MLCLNNFESSAKMAGISTKFLMNDEYVEINRQDKAHKKPEHVLQSADARDLAWSLNAEIDT